jgi:hypothetical protein
MTEDSPKLLSHIPNSGIVHLPGRKFPGIVMQGDSLFSLLHGLRYLLERFKECKDEEHYFETLMIAETLYAQLLHYEETLSKHGMSLPYSGTVKDFEIKNEYE